MQKKPADIPPSLGRTFKEEYRREGKKATPHLFLAQAPPAPRQLLCRRAKGTQVKQAPPLPTFSPVFLLLSPSFTPPSPSQACHADEQGHDPHTFHPLLVVGEVCGILFCSVSLWLPSLRTHTHIHTHTFRFLSCLLLTPSYHTTPPHPSPHKSNPVLLLAFSSSLRVSTPCAHPLPSTE